VARVEMDKLGFLAMHPFKGRYATAFPDQETVELILATTMLYKHDVEAGTTEIHGFGAGRHPGEFVFVPRSPNGGEDDGWLIGLVIDMNTQTTELQILNADDFTGEPQAVIHVPHRIPPGFHGNWMDA